MSGEIIPCPYCGSPIDEDDTEKPADYCSHDEVETAKQKEKI